MEQLTRRWHVRLVLTRRGRLHDFAFGSKDSLGSRPVHFERRNRRERRTLVDHTFLSRVSDLANEWPTAKLEIVGIDALKPHSAHPHSARRRTA